jgi:hypothetical protein
MEAVVSKDIVGGCVGERWERKRERRDATATVMKISKRKRGDEGGKRSKEGQWYRIGSRFGSVFKVCRDGNWVLT